MALRRERRRVRERRVVGRAVEVVRARERFGHDHRRDAGDRDQQPNEADGVGIQDRLHRDLSLRADPLLSPCRHSGAHSTASITIRRCRTCCESERAVLDRFCFFQCVEGIERGATFVQVPFFVFAAGRGKRERRGHGAAERVGRIRARASAVVLTVALTLRGVVFCACVAVGGVPPFLFFVVGAFAIRTVNVFELESSSLPLLCCDWPNCASGKGITIGNLDEPRTNCILSQWRIENIENTRAPLRQCDYLVVYMRNARTNVDSKNGAALSHCSIQRVNRLAFSTGIMITPTRFELKYAPIPTLALEYEDGGGGALGLLYAFKGTDEDACPQQRKVIEKKKLHIVELPTLTKHSEATQIVKQLQKDNRRFLAPEVVNERQLQRLFERLKAHLQATEVRVSTAQTQRVHGDEEEQSNTAAVAETSIHTRDLPGSSSGDKHDDEDDDADDLEESAMEESVAEGSTSMMDDDTTIAKKMDGHLPRTDKDDNADQDTISPTAKHTGASVDNSDDDEERQASQCESPDKRDDGNHASKAKVDDDERDDDALKKKALKSESDVSDEDVESEELEYFSENASDEDSF